ncbi:MAG TPA: AmmeMemoRadiSam system protein B [Syntrophales bacterium]|nr:AmmeMemoRadiSam system protein B [Syntrophales bacterium]
MKTCRIWLILIIPLLLFPAGCQAAEQAGSALRQPVVAGKFYPDSAPMLRLAVEKFMQDALPAVAKDPVAIIVPHAGYVFSGQICADGFNQVRSRNYDTVVILGTNHTSSSFNKVGLYPGRGFVTPLGTAAIDSGIVEALLAECPDCALNTAIHEREHSVEVVVPFVQVLFPGAKIVPAVVGAPDVGLCERFGQALAKVLKGRKALIVASSDLSHYPSAVNASMVDRQTLQAILPLDPVSFHGVAHTSSDLNIRGLSTRACGEAPIMAAMTAARALGATGGVLVSYANSGDTALGERAQVVGYGAMALASGKTGAGGEKSPVPPTGGKKGAALTPSDRKALLRMARETIERFLTTKTAPLARNPSPDLEQTRGMFVTLNKHGALRGCIGEITAEKPLYQLVGSVALKSALEDPRFPPLRREELQDIEIEISVLTPAAPVASADDIVVGRDGVILKKSGRSAVFLPQVATEQGWGRDQMLDQLCMKAGLPAGSWKSGAQFLTFQAEVFSETDIKTSR